MFVLTFVGYKTAPAYLQLPLIPQREGGGREETGLLVYWY